MNPVGPAQAALQCDSPWSCASLCVERRGKRIVAPDGSELVPSDKPQPDGTPVKGLARAWRWQRLLDEGRFGSVRELAEAERVSLSYISRILRLTLLAPEIVERILDGYAAPQLAEVMQPFPGRVGAAADPVLLSSNSN